MHWIKLTYILGDLIEDHTLVLGGTTGFKATRHGEGTVVSNGGGVDVGIYRGEVLGLESILVELRDTK